jgi:hypothetical protein
MSATLRIHRIRKPEEEPKYKITVEKGPSTLNRMGIPKEAERKIELIARLKTLGATDEQIQQAFEEMETSDHADIEGVA